MNDVDKYKALAYSLRSRAQMADPAVQRKEILALAARFEVLANIAEKEQASEIQRLFASGAGAARQRHAENLIASL